MPATEAQTGNKHDMRGLRLAADHVPKVMLSLKGTVAPFLAERDTRQDLRLLIRSL
jgi:hypothetical protein